tara:strand:+ start:37 stop:681 length:645 start_codon:yes stop_codon:yes gene_type:complete
LELNLNKIKTSKSFRQKTFSDCFDKRAMLADKLKSNKISDFTSKMYEKEIGFLEMMMVVCMHYQLKDGKLTKAMEEFGLLGQDKESPLYNEIVISILSSAKADSNSAEILKNVRDVVKLEIHKLEEGIKKYRSPKKSKGKGGRPKGKSQKTIQRYNWIRDQYYILKKKRSGSTYKEFADLIYSELREKTPHYFDKSYKKSTILKVLKNKLWAEE